MIVKKDKEYWFYVCFSHIGVLIVMIAFYFGLNLTIGWTLVVYAPLFLIIVLGAIIYGRTFILSAEGCTVCFLCFQRTYRWEELQTKRIERYPKYSLVRPMKYNPYQKYAMLAHYRVRKPRWVYPEQYSSLHPWSYIYLNSIIQTINYLGIGNPVNIRNVGSIMKSMKLSSGKR